MLSARPLVPQSRRHECPIALLARYDGQAASARCYPAHQRSLRRREAAPQNTAAEECNATIFKLTHRRDHRQLFAGDPINLSDDETLVREGSLYDINFGCGNDTYERDWLKKSRLCTGFIAGNSKSAAGLAVIAGGVLPTRMSAILGRGLNGLT